MIIKALTAAALLASTGVASALTITSSPFDVTPGPDETIVYSFDAPPAPGYTYTGGVIYTTSIPNVAAEPAHDTTAYLAVGSGKSATFTLPEAAKSISIYIGSVDAYNFLEFTGPGYDSGKFSASALPGGDNGNQVGGSTNRRFFFTFGPGESVTSFTLSSTAPAFEVDNIAVATVPEPAVWGLLVGGFALIGVARRRFKARSVAV